MNSIPAPVIVLGFPRSGTSLVAQLAASAGYFFGEHKNNLKPDVRNPQGYFEYAPAFSLSRRFIREAGGVNELEPLPHSLRARGFLNRFSRIFTRRAIMQTIDNLASHNKFGIKLFPRFWYFWKQYLPKNVKIIVVYREPSSVLSSFMSAWPAGGYTADQILSFWEIHNRDLLFHIRNASEVFVLKYEDLFDKAMQKRALSALEDFLEVSPNHFKEIINPKLNRSPNSSLILSDRIKEIQHNLDSTRSYI